MKKEIIAKLVKIAAKANQVDMAALNDASQYRFPLNYSDLIPDPGFDAPERTGTTTDSYYSRHDGNIYLPVNTEMYNQEDPNSASITKGMIYGLNEFPAYRDAQMELWHNIMRLSRIKRHENTHRLVNLIPGRVTAPIEEFKRFESIPSNPENASLMYSADDYNVYPEIPALVQEQLWNAAPGYVSFAKDSAGQPVRAVKDRVDLYYDLLFPQVSPGSDKRKFYWTPQKGWINAFGRVAQAPHMISTLESFQGDKDGNRAIKDMPAPWQNAIRQLSKVNIAAQQYKNNPEAYSAAQKAIYKGLTPLHARFNPTKIDPMTQTRVGNLAALDPIPIGMPGLQMKHYITPTFNRETDVRTMEQMQDIQNDINHSYKLDSNLRQNWAPMGSNSAGA